MEAGTHKGMPASNCLISRFVVRYIQETEHVYSVVLISHY